MILLFFQNVYATTIEIVPYLLFGLFIAGLLKSFVPSSLIVKNIGKDNWISSVKAAILGAPVPLCSCSVIPVAIQLRKSGAKRGPITSFLISAPETGADSLMITYAILGPFMLVIRIITALFTAIATALAMSFFIKEPMPETKNNCGCKGSSCKNEEGLKNKSLFIKLYYGLKHSFTSLLDDSIKWIIIAIILTAILKTFLPENAFSILNDYPLLSLVAVFIVSFSMYICASASTPIAASLMFLGMSPGAALIFMIAGPASNIATIGVVKNIMGKKSAILYVFTIGFITILSGYILDFFVNYYKIDIQSSIHKVTLLPNSTAITLTVILILFSIKPIRKYIWLK